MMLPDVIHSVDNIMPKTDISISLHVYGRDLRHTDRHIYDEKKEIMVPNPNSEFEA